MSDDHALSGISDPADIHAYVQDVWGDANSCMSPEHRATVMLEHVNVQLAALGIPPLGWRFSSARGDGAALIFWEWVIELGDHDYTMDIADSADVEQQAYQIKVVYHEARHAEQWFQIARARAGLGETPDQIATSLQLPPHVAEVAALFPMTPQDGRYYQAEEWYESVYGTGRPHRHEVLTHQPERYAEYRALPEEKDAWAVADATAQDYRHYSP
jgi:hypothetical protein